MPIQSDLTLNISKFQPSSVSEDTKKLNTLLEDITAKTPRWYKVGVAKYREMRENGETPLGLPTYLPAARDATVPSREAGREIPVRVYEPENGQPSKGIFLHFHGGGFVMASHKHSDDILKMYANACQLTAISVGYRLAPENPYPAGIQDCFDAAEYLVDHGEKEYGAKMLYIGGESAGGCLTAVTAFHLMRSRPTHKLAGLIFPYGLFDLTLNLPQLSTYTRLLMIHMENLQRCNEAYVPGMSIEERRDASVSPLYENMQALASSLPGKSLPPALFLCGTEEMLLDDTLLMSMKWMIAGGEAVVKIYPGAPHGFTVLPGAKVAEEAAEVITRFVREKLEARV